ncbi:hypothetical protein GCM10009548_51690 [Streptomyces malaysiensis subsp. malaysiensis]
MWSHASGAVMFRAVRPITATSSTSQSVWPSAGRTTSVTGPVRQLGHLVNSVVGVFGTEKPDSDAWSR